MPIVQALTAQLVVAKKAADEAAAREKKVGAAATHCAVVLTAHTTLHASLNGMGPCTVCNS